MHSHATKSGTTLSQTDFFDVGTEHPTYTLYAKNYNLNNYGKKWFEFWGLWSGMVYLQVFKMHPLFRHSKYILRIILLIIILNLLISDILFSVVFLSFSELACLLLNKKIGCIKEGYLADGIFIKKQDLDLDPIHNPYASIVHSANENSIKAVMIGGKIIHGKI